MSTLYTPRPTEYRGIVFRSKSEALMARIFDLETEVFPQLWEYEPELFRLPDGYVPDFLLMRPRRSETTRSVLAVIEYKPARPTETYFRELAGRFNAIRERLPKMEGYCIYGSFFDPPGPLWICDPRRPENAFVYTTENGVAQARAFRFDLEDRDE